MFGPPGAFSARVMSSPNYRYADYIFRNRTSLCILYIYAWIGFKFFYMLALSYLDVQKKSPQVLEPFFFRS